MAGKAIDADRNLVVARAAEVLWVGGGDDATRRIARRVAADALFDARPPIACAFTHRGAALVAEQVHVDAPHLRHGQKTLPLRRRDRRAGRRGRFVDGSQQQDDRDKRGEAKGERRRVAPQ